MQGAEEAAFRGCTRAQLDFMRPLPRDCEFLDLPTGSDRCHAVQVSLLTVNAGTAMAERATIRLFSRSSSPRTRPLTPVLPIPFSRHAYRDGRKECDDA
jgi:hypothetical protein